MVLLTVCSPCAMHPHTANCARVLVFADGVRYHSGSDRDHDPWWHSEGSQGHVLHALTGGGPTARGPLAGTRRYAAPDSAGSSVDGPPSQARPVPVFSPMATSAAVMYELWGIGQLRDNVQNPSHRWGAITLSPHAPLHHQARAASLTTPSLAQHMPSI